MQPMKGHSVWTTQPPPVGAVCSSPALLPHFAVRLFLCVVLWDRWCVVPHDSARPYPEL